MKLRVVLLLCALISGFGIVHGASTLSASPTTIYTGQPVTITVSSSTTVTVTKPSGSASTLAFSGSTNYPGPSWTPQSGTVATDEVGIYSVTTSGASTSFKVTNPSPTYTVQSFVALPNGLMVGNDVQASFQIAINRNGYLTNGSYLVQVYNPSSVEVSNLTAVYNVTVSAFTTNSYQVEDSGNWSLKIPRFGAVTSFVVAQSPSHPTPLSYFTEIVLGMMILLSVVLSVGRLRRRKRKPTGAKWADRF